MFHLMEKLFTEITKGPSKTACRAAHSPRDFLFSVLDIIKGFVSIGKTEFQYSLPICCCQINYMIPVSFFQVLMMMKHRTGTIR